MSAKIVDKEEKKIKILMAAITLFARKGFEKTTINDISKEAGIGKGTVYEYFHNKEEMINESFHFFLSQMDLDHEHILKENTTAAEKMKQILSSFSYFIRPETEGLINMMFMFWGEAMRDQTTKNIIFHEMKNFYSEYRGLFMDIVVMGMQDGSFRKNINPEHIASIIIGMLDGMMVQWLLDRELIRYDEMISSVVTFVIDGIAER
jgi:AcrR family transcriptional regulator